MAIKKVRIKNGTPIDVHDARINGIDSTPTLGSDNVVTSGGVRSALNGITDKIPAQASSTNQLADKAFVNSSIETATAEFKGTFNSLAELEQVTANKNDYGFVISTDASGNTVYNRYKHNGTTWVFEYALNNSSFTAAQWAAIQSGITSTLVTKLNGIADGAEVNVQSDWDASSGDAFIKNKPQNLVQDADYVHTDNNYTTTEKNKLSGIESGAQKNAAGTVVDASYVHTDNNFTTAEKNKLDGIESGAEANVQSNWNESDSSSDAFIKNKPQNLVQDASYVHTDNNYTTAEKNKLGGIATGAQVNVIEGVKVNGIEQTITNKKVDISVPTQLSDLSDDATHRVVTDTEKSTWNGKYTKPSGGIPANDIDLPIKKGQGGSNSIQSKQSGIAALANGSSAFGNVSGDSLIYSYGVGSHSEGAARTTSDDYPGYIYANGVGSHAEGYANENTIRADGDGSHAEGYADYIAPIEALGKGSHAEGYGTRAENFSEHAEGHLNKSNKASNTYGNAGNTQHSVGIGADNYHRKNAHEIMQNGDHYIYGLGGYDGTNPSSSQTVQQVINGKTSMMEITWGALKALRDNSQLVKGAQYRITDYVTTTVQEDTQSANHPFDIIVVADAENILNENARAILHSGDTYFATANLESWEIKYCLDNDTNQFAWADSTNGKGVIYWMKDEWNNECPYDFKNIQFKRTISDVDVFCYTFGKDSDFSRVGVAYSNVIKECTSFSYGYGGRKIELSGNVFLLTNYMGRTRGNYLDINCKNNTFGDGCEYNYLGEDSSSNTLGDGCRSNKFYLFCASNTLGNNCYENIFTRSSSNKLGNNCYQNTFKIGCSSNRLGVYSCHNQFDNNCQANSIGDNGVANVFGYNCYSIILGERCTGNHFGVLAMNITIGNDSNYNVVGDKCQNIRFGNDSTIKDYYQFIVIESGNNRIRLYCTATTSSNQTYKNVTISSGVNDAITYKDIVDNNVGQNYKTTYQPANSQVINV